MTKIVKISLLPIVLLLISMLLFGCASKMEASTVYESFLEYAKQSNNIFTVTTYTNEQDITSELVSVKINYKINENDENEIDYIGNALINEQNIYLTTGKPKSDFYLIKEIYEPTLNFSLNFFLKNLNFLKSSSKSISKENAGLIYDKFSKLKKSIEAFDNSLSALKYYRLAFKPNDDNTQIDEYADKKGIVYKQLDNFKTKFATLINDCFELNNQFIKVYYTVYNPTDYIVEDNDLEGLYVQMICSEVSAKLSSVGFLVDGVKCNLTNTNKSSFEIENESSVIDHTYIKHLSKISNTTQSLISKTGEDFQELDGNNAVKELIIVLQNQYKIFDKQYDRFIKALNSINYKDFVASNKTLHEYANTLNETQKSYLYVVEDFLDDIYTNLVMQLENIINII